MSIRTGIDNQQLAESLAALGDAASRSERRLERFERIFRWGLVAFLICVTVVFAAAFSSMNNAFAQRSPSGQEALLRGDNVVEALNNINASLESMRMMGMMMRMGMQSAVTEAMTPPENDPECQDPDTVLVHNLYCFAHAHTQKRAEALNTEIDQLSPEQRQQFAQEAVMIAAGSVIVDMGILTHRIKQDSDFWRTSGLKGIKDELGKLNHMVTAIPVMANEMTVMNRQMSVMSHGVGSTMGRMGTWLPW
jgi:hypothetical protein